MRKPLVRTALVATAAVFAIAVPFWQTTTEWGLSAAAFAAQGDQTLRVAGYAFSIWSVLYLGMAAYAIYQGLPSTPESLLLQAYAWPSVIAMAGCGVWIFASAANLQWASVAVIVVSALALLSAMMRARSSSNAERWLVALPLHLLAGWLTVAAAANVLLVMTARDLISSEQARFYALGVIAVATLLGAGFSFAAAYPLAIAWGLVGVFVAELSAKPVVAYMALGCAGLLCVIALLSALRQRPPPSALENYFNR